MDRKVHGFVVKHVSDFHYLLVRAKEFDQYERLEERLMRCIRDGELPGGDNAFLQCHVELEGVAEWRVVLFMAFLATSIFPKYRTVGIWDPARYKYITVKPQDKLGTQFLVTD